MEEEILPILAGWIIVITVTLDLCVYCQFQTQHSQKLIQSVC